MFLARMGILIDNVKFFPLKDYVNVNKESDIIITNNEDIINVGKSTYITVNKKESDLKNNEIVKVTSFKELVENEYIERNELA
jgi:hypothetical protein